MTTGVQISKTSVRIDTAALVSVIPALLWRDGERDSRVPGSSWPASLEKSEARRPYLKVEGKN